MLLLLMLSTQLFAQAPKRYAIEATQLDRFLSQPEEQIDLARAKLMIDKFADSATDTEAIMRKLNAMVASVREESPSSARSNHTLAILKKHVYEKGPWNDNRPFQYDKSDPLGTRIENKLLATYLETRQGNCISMPFLFLILGDKLGLKVAASTAPLHVFVKYTDPETGQTTNLETTDGANPTSGSSYRKQLHMTDRAIANGVYMQPLTKKETVAVMAILLVEYFLHQKDYVKAMAISDVILKYYPRSLVSG